MKYKVKFVETIEYEVEFDIADGINKKAWANGEWFDIMSVCHPKWENRATRTVKGRELLGTHCKQCGKFFETVGRHKRSDKVYCGNACVVKAYRERKKKRKVLIDKE